MQPNMSEIPLRPRQSPWSNSELAKLWLEEEDFDEVKKIEELKKKQRALEKELAEKRKTQQQQKEQAG